METPPELASEYRLSAEFYPQLTRRMLRIFVPFVVVAPLFGWYATGGGKDGATYFAVGAVTVVALGTAWLNTRRQHRSFRTFRLQVSGGALVREQERFNPITFTPDSIDRIEENAHGLTVYGKTRGLQLGVPHTLANYEQFKEQLEALHSIETMSPRRWSGTVTLAAVVAVVVGMVTVYRAQNAWVVLGASTVLVVFLVWSFIAIQRSPIIDQRTKRSSWLMVFVLLSLTIGIYSAIQQLRG